MHTNNLGVYLNTKRINVNMSQAELGERIGVDPIVIERWEKGLCEPEMRYIIPLADIFEVSVEELLRAYSIDNEVEARDLIINQAVITEAKYLEQGDRKIKVKFRVKDFFVPTKLTRAYSKFTNSHIKSYKDFIELIRGTFKGVFKRHTKNDLEQCLTKGMHKSSKQPNLINYGEITPPWVFFRIFIALLIVVGLSIVTDSWTMIMIMGSAVAPVTILFLIYELNFPKNLSIIDVIKCFFIGGLASILLVFVFREATGYPEGFWGDMLTGFVEEVAKVFIVIYFISKLKPRFILSGMLIGASVGAGFDVFETAEYAMSALIDESLFEMYMNLLFRGLTAFIIGHHYWTMVLAGCLTMIIGDKKANIKYLSSKNFLIVLAFIITLHGLWNYSEYLELSLAVGAITLTLVLLQLNVGIIQYKIAHKANLSNFFSSFTNEPVKVAINELYKDYDYEDD